MMKLIEEKKPSDKKNTHACKPCLGGLARLA
jgi:hypothetical protein